MARAHHHWLCDLSGHPLPLLPLSTITTTMALDWSLLSSAYLECKGIRRACSAYYHLQANGGAERFHQSLKNVLRAHPARGCSSTLAIRPSGPRVLLRAGHPSLRPEGAPPRWPSVPPARGCSSTLAIRPSGPRVLHYALAIRPSGPRVLLQRWPSVPPARGCSSTLIRPSGPRVLLRAGHPSLCYTTGATQHHRASSASPMLGRELNPPFRLPLPSRSFPSPVSRGG